MTRHTIALLAASLLLPATASAQGMTFEVDPLVLAVQQVDVDSESAKFEEYRDLEDGFEIPLLHIVGSVAGSDRYLDFRAEDVRRDDARYTLGYGVWGRYGLELDHNKIPHRFGNDATLLWDMPDRGVFAIPDPTQAYLQDQIATGGSSIGFLRSLLAPFLATADRVDISLQRDRTNATFDFGGLGGLTWALEVDHESRDGFRPWSGSFGFGNSSEILEPIDYTTGSAELRGEWNAANAGVRFGYRHSEFENDVSTLFWDNPLRLTNGAEGALGFADLAPDNDSDLLFVNGRARFGGWRVQGDLGYNVMSQDDPLLPFTLNDSLVGVGFDGQPIDLTDPASLPADSADLEVEVLNASVDAGTTFAEVVSLDLHYRYYDYDNTSSRLQFPGYVRFHSVWNAVPRVSVPYSYTRSKIGADLGWQIGDASHLELSYDLEEWDREFRETEGTSEDVLALTFDTRFVEGLTLRARYEIGDRTIDGPYETEAQEASFVHPEGINNQPGMRKFLQAEREYDEWNFSADYLVGESMSVRGGISGRDEEYPDSQFGLVDSDVLVYNAELDYAAGGGMTLYAFVTREDRDARQESRQSAGTLSTDPAANWTAAFDETTDTVGLGFAGDPEGRFSWDLSASWSSSDGDADISSPPGGTPDVGIGFTDYDDIDLLAVLAEIGYELSESVTVGLSHRYEDYSADEFLFDGLQNIMPGAILLVPENGDYTGNVTALYLRFRL